MTLRPNCLATLNTESISAGWSHSSRGTLRLVRVAMCSSICMISMLLAFHVTALHPAIQKHQYEKVPLIQHRSQSPDAGGIEDLFGPLGRFTSCVVRLHYHD